MIALCEFPGLPDPPNILPFVFLKTLFGIFSTCRGKGKERRKRMFWVGIGVELLANIDLKISWETRDTYGPPGISLNFSWSWTVLTCIGFRGIFTNQYVALCAAFSALGGFLFGYEYVHLNGSKMCTLANPYKPRSCVSNSRHGSIPEQVSSSLGNCIGCWLLERSSHCDD
jgi:hypothetical protein